MKRAVILFFGLFVFLVSAAWGQTVTGSATTGNDDAQGGQNAPCGTGCLCSPPGLIGWWTGDGNAKDVQGAGLPCLRGFHAPSNGILMNGTKFAWGFVGPAFSFDGVDDYVDVPDTPTLHTITTAVTVEAWVNPQPLPSTSGYYGYVFARRDPFVSEGFSIAIDWGGGMKIEMQTDVSSIFIAALPVTQFDGKWRHLAATADTATEQVRLYVDGTPVDIQFAAGSPNISGNFASVSHLFIGQRESSGDTTNRYKGLIDEVGFYNRALTPAEIQAIYLVGHSGRCKASSNNRQ